MGRELHVTDLILEFFIYLLRVLHVFLLLNERWKKGPFPTDLKCKNRTSQRAAPHKKSKIWVCLLYFVDMETDLEGGSDLLRTSGYYAF